MVLQAERFEEASEEGNVTEAREAQRILNKLRDTRKLLLLLGLAQLLELYVVSSLQAQHSKRFPTQTWSVVSDMRRKVEALGKGWRWEEEELRYSGTEAPADIVERIVKEGVYRPAVSRACVRGNRLRKEANLLEEGKTIKDLFNEEGLDVKPLAGEVCLEVPLDWKRQRQRHKVGEGSRLDVEGGGGSPGGEVGLLVGNTVHESIIRFFAILLKSWNVSQSQGVSGCQSVPGADPGTDNARD